MLSVQSPGYAGMERLGTPGGPGGGGADRLRQCRDFNDLSHLQNMPPTNYSMLMDEIYARQHAAHHPELLNCPPQIALPDGEAGQGRNFRVPYQQAELTRSAVHPPPNKSVQDTPDFTPPASIPRKPPSPHKKDGFMQRAGGLVQKYLVKLSSGKGAETAAHAGTVTAVETGAVAAAGGGGGTAGAEANRRAPCVMVPLRPPPAPAPPPSAPTVPPSPPHAPPS